MTAKNALVEAIGLTKHFQIKKNQVVHAVDDVTLTVHEKEIVGLVGESGSGKSTLGKTLLGLHDKTAGQVIYDGETLPQQYKPCLLYTSPSPRDQRGSRMPSSA